MELDRRILAYVAYRASRSALLNQLNEIRLTVEAITEVIKRLNISQEKRAEVDRFFKEAQQDFGQMLKDSFEKAKADAISMTEAYLKDSGDGKKDKTEIS